MNETDFIRRQLREERIHLREVLAGLQGEPAAGAAAEVAQYCLFATQRLIGQASRHGAALPMRLAPATTGRRARAEEALSRLARCREQAEASLAGLRSALAQTPGEAAQTFRAALDSHRPPLQRLLEAWTDELEALAGPAYGIEDWRQAARLSADSILEERRLYARARTASDRARRADATSPAAAGLDAPGGHRASGGHGTPGGHAAPGTDRRP